MRTITAFVVRKSKWALFAKVLQAVEGFSHVGVLHPMQNGMWFVSDMTGDGFRITEYSKWKERYHIKALVHIEIPYSKNPVFKNGLELIDRLTLDHGPDIFKMKYGHAQLFWDGLEIVSQWFGAKEWNLWINGKRRQVCSEWAARFYAGHGLWRGDKNFDMVTLRDCFNGLKKVARKVEEF